MTEQERFSEQKRIREALEQAMQEQSLDKIASLAEEYFAIPTHYYDYSDSEVYIDVMMFFVKSISEKPELAEMLRPYDKKVRDAYRIVRPYAVSKQSDNHNYVALLSEALRIAPNENRLDLLKKIEATIKNSPELQSDAMYGDLTFHHGPLETLIPQNKQEENILVNILKTTATRDTRPYVHQKTLQAKPELTSAILPILSKVIKNQSENENSQFRFNDNFSEWMTEQYKQHPSMIKHDKGLMKYVDNKLAQQDALGDPSIIPNLAGISKDNFDRFATIYEEHATRDPYEQDLLGPKNVVLSADALDKSEHEVMNAIRDKLLDSDRDWYSKEVSKPVQVWLVKSAKRFPHLVQDCLQSEKLPYVEMCLKHIENPEEENIGSLLNRLEAKKVENIEDFHAARDFVARRDMSMRVTGGYKEISYDMAEAGISDAKTAKRVYDLFCALNPRPDTYNSDYNKYYPTDLLPIAKSNVMQDWMYPVMMNAVKEGVLTLSEGRMPSERTLFNCCKAWKINPSMPQRLARTVGNHSLRGRMLAGAIFDKMCADGETTLQEWRDNKVLHEKFYEELARAEKMPTKEAFKQYIPNTPVNRKRLVGMGMEEKGIENTPKNFKALYRQVREKGIFEEMLAKPEDARTTISARFLVETARRKFNPSR